MNQTKSKRYVASNSILLLLPVGGLLAVCWFAVFQTNSQAVAQQQATAAPHPANNHIKPNEGNAPYRVEQVYVAHAAGDGTIVHQSIPQMVPSNHYQSPAPMVPNPGWNSQTAMLVPHAQSPQERELVMRIGTMVAEFSSERDSGRRDAVRERLNEAVNEHFGLLNERRNNEIAQHEARLKQAQETQRKRETEREKIVAAQVDRLLGTPDLMDWNPPLLAPAAGQPSLSSPWMPIGVPGPVHFQNPAIPQPHVHGFNPYQPANNNFHPVPGA